MRCKKISKIERLLGDITYVKKKKVAFKMHIEFETFLLFLVIGSYLLCCVFILKTNFY